jgi:hypothetical protein
MRTRIAMKARVDSAAVDQLHLPQTSVEKITHQKQSFAQRHHVEPEGATASPASAA